MLAELCEALNTFRPLARDVAISVEIDPTEVDEPRLRTLQAEASDTEAALADRDGTDIAERLEREGFGPRTRPTGGDVLARLRRKAGLTQAA